jgi:hypothetical protein
VQPPTRRSTTRTRPAAVTKNYAKLHQHQCLLSLDVGELVWREVLGTHERVMAADTDASRPPPRHTPQAPAKAQPDNDTSVNMRAYYAVISQHRAARGDTAVSAARQSQATAARQHTCRRRSARRHVLALQDKARVMFASKGQTTVTPALRCTFDICTAEQSNMLNFERQASIHDITCSK